MKIQIPRKNNFIQRWWKVIDQKTIIATVILFLFSLILVATSSPTVANRIGLSSNYFFFRHIVFSLCGELIILTFSFLDKEWVKRLSMLGFGVNLIILVLVRFYGFEAKGATRWINLRCFSYQPSEFIKPFLFVVTGWILSLHYYRSFPSFRTSFILFLVVAFLLIIQPDFGMLAMVSLVFNIQLFIAGLPIIWLFFIIIALFTGSILAYFLLDHVASRVDSFLDPDNTEYQIAKSLEAFESGGLYGKGPGEGSVKHFLPDSHTDFIFAVAGEEFGAIICLIIIIIFTYIVIRVLISLLYEEDKFIQISSIGIISQFGLQAIINMGVNLKLLPTKGMTLPFISYGGSSTLAMSMGIGMLLALTKRKTSLVKYRIQNIG